MTFDDILAQVLAQLQCQARVSYRALKRRFGLDDEYIEDLKAEIIHAQHLAVDEDGAVLVWTGEAPETPTSASQPDPTPRPDPQLAEPTQDDSSSPEPRTPDAERRQLTVMFCDLVGSTELSGQLDPEDYREVVREYQKACTQVIERFDGYVAQYLGDGLLVYFGYPHSHEDEAQRAVYTGLGILDAMKQLNTLLQPKKGVSLKVRVGIHTGVVVVGDIGAGSRQEQLALGETPNISARIQGLADPDSVVISSSTHRLIQGYFDCQELGEQKLRGVVEPVVVYRALKESDTQSRFEAASTKGLTPFVGREQEIGLLLERWAQSLEGYGQLVLLSGDAGIGKSRLVHAWSEQVTGVVHTRIECHCSSYTQHSMLYPLLDHLQHVLQFEQDDPPADKGYKLEAWLDRLDLSRKDFMPSLAPWFSLPLMEGYAPSVLSPLQQKQRYLKRYWSGSCTKRRHNPSVLSWRTCIGRIP